MRCQLRSALLCWLHLSLAQCQRHPSPPPEQVNEQPRPAVPAAKNDSREDIAAEHEPGPPPGNEGSIGLGLPKDVGPGSGFGMYGAKVGKACKEHPLLAPDGSVFPRPVKAEVKGSSDSRSIRESIQRHGEELRRCDESSCPEDKIVSDGALDCHEIIYVRFSIAPTGAVTSAEVLASTVRDPRHGQCLISTIKRWKFQLPQHGVMTVTYPFRSHCYGL